MNSHASLAEVAVAAVQAWLLWLVLNAATVAIRRLRRRHRTWRARRALTVHIRSTTTPGDTPMIRLLRRIAAAVGSPAPTPVPARFARPAAGELNRALTDLGHQLDETRRAARALNQPGMAVYPQSQALPSARQRQEIGGGSR